MAQQRHTCAHCLMLKRQFLVPRKPGSKPADMLNHDMNCKHYKPVMNKKGKIETDASKKNVSTLYLENLGNLMIYLLKIEMDWPCKS